MGKLFVLLGVLLFAVSCKEQPKTEALADSSALEFKATELPKRSNINSKAQIILKGWPEFNALENGFDALYKVENNEELILTVEDIVEKQNQLAVSDYPETFDLSQIKSRQKVLKTYILKLKAASEYRVGTKDAAVELIEAYNAFRNQFNVTVNYALDTELIFED